VESLKRIGEGAVDAALDKAERYRLLNDPVQAESICLDVLEVDGGNQRAKRTLLLALTDQFAEATVSSRVKTARALAAELTDDYERVYYEAIVWEREGRSFLAKGLPGAFAYECLREAMALFERAEAIRPPGNDDALLRWNSCVRTIRDHDLHPREDTSELPLE
jgi:hypothetical protein